MRNRFAYQIEVSRGDGRWHLMTRRAEAFTRDPKSVARSILEQWIIGHPDKVKGGERISVYGPTAAPHLDNGGASVRVTVFNGEHANDAQVPAAVAYLGPDERDYRWSPGPTATASSLLARGRRHLGRRLRGRMPEAA